MPIKDQLTNRWVIVAAATVGATAGVVGLVQASDGGGGGPLPDAIALSDTVAVERTVEPTATEWDIVPNQVVPAGDTADDSPLDTPVITDTAPQDPVVPAAPNDSPDDSPNPTSDAPVAVSADSPDPVAPAPNGPQDDSVDSPDDSAGGGDSPDESA